MAIFAPDISVCTRGATAGAVASAAYIGRERLELERTGEVFDYTRSHQHELLVHDFGITIPEHAPERLRDRSTLWNEVEQIERSENAQLARKIMIPLPDELSREQQIELAREIIQQRVEQGHIIDAALHVNLPNKEHSTEYNMHLHMQEPLREVDEKGFRQKSETTYLVRDMAREREQYMSAKELKQAQERGESWEKVYPYKIGKEYAELTKTQAIERGLDPIKDRKRKQPIQETRYLNAGWNDKQRAEEWRQQWAEKMNQALERAGRPERVDHRSYERQGLELIPQRHEGYKVQALERQAEREAERQGREYTPVTDERKHNIEVRETNELLLRAQEMLRRMKQVPQAVKEHVQEWQRGFERAYQHFRRALREPQLAYAYPVKERNREQQRTRQFAHHVMRPKREQEMERRAERHLSREQKQEREQVREIKPGERVPQRSYPQADPRIEQQMAYESARALNRGQEIDHGHELGIGR